MTSELKKASVGPVFIGGIFVFLLFALLVKVWFAFSTPAENYEDKRAAARVAKRQALDRDNREKLTTYAWVSKEKGVVQIPIDNAMKIVAAELKTKPVQASSVKVEIPYPAGLQQPPPGSAAPAPAMPAAASPAPSAPAVAAPPAAAPAAAMPAPAAAPAPAAPAAVATPANSPTSTPAK